VLPWRVSGLQGLDGDHGSAAGGAGKREAWRFLGLGEGRGLVLWRLDIEQLARPGEVLGAPAVGKESVVADAMEALGQDVKEESPDELVAGPSV